MNRIRRRPLGVGPLRAFEAVARRLSFRAAAEELHLTQPAVSRQIRALEDELGAPLFSRGTRHVELTGPGTSLLRATAPLLEQLVELSAKAVDEDSTPDTPVERAAWVVEVPRAPTALEKKNLPKEEIAAWPAVPPYKVGDQVLATGTWATTSAHGESNTDGLLVYKSMKNVTQNWESPPPDPNALPPATIAPPPH